MKLTNYILQFLVCISFGLSAFGQNVQIKRIDVPITIDGVMDEAVWAEMDVADKFNQYFPYDSSLAIAQTEVRMAYDDNNLYVIAVMHNLGPRKYVVPSLRRDFRGEAFDGFTVVLDTYKDRTNAFLFGVNPFGAQREGLISEGGNFSRGSNSGSRAFSLTWDNKWYADAKMYDDYWIAEMAIPFKTLRYKENMDSWYINFYRIDSEYGERSSWAPIPRNLSIINLAFSKEVGWEEPIKNPGSNISLIPYMAYTTAKNFEPDENGVVWPTDNKFAIGGDAKIGLTSALNLDLTINPDFSQVETDQQVTNLDRFEIFFPEQRQFFLENADLFSSFGSSGARPFFSRRIGVARDTSTGTNVQNPLYFGARLSGNLNNKWRVGFMSVQAAEDNSFALPTINYTVATVQHRIGPRSNIAGFLVSKVPFQIVDSLGQDSEGRDSLILRDGINISPTDGNLAVGADLNLATPDNKWSGKAYYHHSFSGANDNNDYSLGIAANHRTYRWESRADYRSLGNNYDPEVGFVRRAGFNQFRQTTYYNFYPAGGAVQSHAPGFDFDFLHDNEFGWTDWDMNILYRINFRNTARFSMRLRKQYTYLFEPFDPSGTGGLELPADTDYPAYQFIGNFSSDQRKPFFYELSTRSGEYFNGTRINLEGTLSYRFLPYAITALNFEYNRIRLPEPYNDADLYLIGPRIDLTFTKNIFWTTFIQYNSQIENMNINTRFQWRYSPVSDLFIVYTDNYFAGIDDRFIDFNRPKSRALVVKLTYWFNP